MPSFGITILEPIIAVLPSFLAADRSLARDILNLYYPNMSI